MTKRHVSFFSISSYGSSSYFINEPLRDCIAMQSYTRFLHFRMHALSFSCLIPDRIKRSHAKDFLFLHTLYPIELILSKRVVAYFYWLEKFEKARLKMTNKVVILGFNRKNCYKIAIISNNPVHCTL